MNTVLVKNIVLPTEDGTRVRDEKKPSLAKGSKGQTYFTIVFSVLQEL